MFAQNIGNELKNRNSNYFRSPNLYLSTMSQSELLQKEFISVAEFMQLFDISRATAQRLLKSSEVAHSKLGGKIIIPTRPLREKFGL